MRILLSVSMAPKPILAQRECVARWGSVAACQRMDGTGSTPTLSYDDSEKAKHRVCLRKAHGPDDVSAELLATWGPVASWQVYYLLCSDCRP